MTTKKKADPATDARKLNNLALWAWQWSGNLMPVARFIDAVDAGLQPDRKDMQHVALALRELFCHRDTDASLQALGDHLCARRKNGKRELTGKEAEPMMAAIFDVAEIERSLVADGATTRSARANAMRDVAAKRSVSLRTVQAWHKQHRAHVRALIHAAETVRKRHKRAANPPD